MNICGCNFLLIRNYVSGHLKTLPINIREIRNALISRFFIHGDIPTTLLWCSETLFLINKFTLFNNNYPSDPSLKVVETPFDVRSLNKSGWHGGSHEIFTRGAPTRISGRLKIAVARKRQKRNHRHLQCSPRAACAAIPDQVRESRQ